jgi:3-oxoacyl-[acyl-carrier-protein] synthase-3
MTPSPKYSRITGTGSFLPPNRVSNEALAAQLGRDGIETSDQWIVDRTGIKARHFAAADVTSSDLAFEAAKRALAAATSTQRAST